jgi:hypothetical protein
VGALPVSLWISVTPFPVSRFRREYRSGVARIVSLSSNAVTCYHCFHDHPDFFCACCVFFFSSNCCSCGVRVCLRVHVRVSVLAGLDSGRPELVYLLLSHAEFSEFDGLAGMCDVDKLPYKREKADVDRFPAGGMH